MVFDISDCNCPGMLLLMAMISYLPALRVRLFGTGKTFFCCCILSFQHIHKLCQWLLWKCLIQLLYFIFNRPYQPSHTVFTMVYFQCISNMLMGKGDVYTPFRWYTCAYFFCIRCFVFSASLYFIHLLYIISTIWVQDAFNVCK